MQIRVGRFQIRCGRWKWTGSSSSHIFQICSRKVISWSSTPQHQEISNYSILFLSWKFWNNGRHDRYMTVHCCVNAYHGAWGRAGFEHCCWSKKATEEKLEMCPLLQLSPAALPPPWSHYPNFLCSFRTLNSHGTPWSWRFASFPFKFQVYNNRKKGPNPNPKPPPSQICAKIS